MFKTRIVLTGGLGNQMFQYAMALKLRLQGKSAIIDTSFYDFVEMHNGYELERVFGIQEKVIKKKGLYLYFLRYLNKYHPSLLVTYDLLTYNQENLKSPKLYMIGNWQDERYFKDVRDKVCDKFVFKHIDAKNQLIANEMTTLNSVSIHLRRGDYASFGMTLVGADYYKKAIEKIKILIDNAQFYIFSDDLDEANKMAQAMSIKYKLIGHNKGKDSYKDMFLMTQCKHNIIANSSFSWWGAWLNNNKGKHVVAPKTWIESCSNLKPQAEDWILL